MVAEQTAADLAAIANDWLVNAIATCGRSETAALRSITKRIVQQFGGLCADEIDPDTVLTGYARFLTDAGLKPKNHLRVLRRILGHAQRRGFLASDPRAGFQFSESAIGAASLGRNRQPRKKTRKNIAMPTNRVLGRRQPVIQTQRPNRARSPNPIPSTQTATQPNPKPNRATHVPSPNGWRYFRLGDRVFEIHEGDEAAAHLAE